MHALRYAFDEAMLSLRRGRRSGMMSTATIALALFVFGAFLLVTSNLQRLGTHWSNAAEVSVYLTDNVTAADRAGLEVALAPGNIVAALEYVSKEEAVRRFKQTFSDLAGAIDGTGENPLPASYEVRLQAGADAQQAVEGLAGRLRAMSGVADVRYDRQWLDRLLMAVGVIRGVGFVLGLVLATAAALTVANVVRLALHARRDELGIMRLIGAPQVYIRGPFVMEGVLQGGVGGILALAGLSLAFLLVRSIYVVPLASTADVSSIGFLPLGFSALLVIGGMAVGCAGGLAAAWDH